MTDGEFLDESLRTTAAGLFGGGTSVSLDALLELGWEELVDAEPVTAVTALAEEQGRALGTSRLVEMVMGRVLGIDSRREALAFAVGATACKASVDALLLAGADDIGTIVVPIRSGDGVGLGRLHASDLDRELVTGIDPRVEWTRVRGAVPTRAPTTEPVWPDAVAAGSRALAHELLGVVAAMVELAVDHVKQRHQFGVPIGSFQAVQHRLADTFVDSEAARAVARTAWVGRDLAASSAALFAARQALESATRHCHQVMGAIACAWEHPLHRYIRRGVLLSSLLDPSGDLAELARTALVAADPVELLA